MLRLSPRKWLAVGLLLVALGALLRSVGPPIHSQLGDLALGLVFGVGIGIELMAIVKMRRGGGG